MDSGSDNTKLVNKLRTGTSITQLNMWNLDWPI